MNGRLSGLALIATALTGTTFAKGAVAEVTETPLNHLVFPPGGRYYVCQNIYAGKKTAPEGHLQSREISSSRSRVVEPYPRPLGAGKRPKPVNAGMQENLQLFLLWHSLP